MNQKRANRTTVQAVVRRLLAWPVLLILDAGIWACGCGKWFELRKASNAHSERAPIGATLQCDVGNLDSGVTHD